MLSTNIFCVLLSRSYSLLVLFWCFFATRKVTLEEVAKKDGGEKKKKKAKKETKKKDKDKEKDTKKEKVKTAKKSDSKPKKVPSSSKTEVKNANQVELGVRTDKKSSKPEAR